MYRTNTDPAGAATLPYLNAAIRELVVGHYHMWYVPMLVGLDLVIPLLRPIARNDRLSRYFIALSLAFAFLLPQAWDVALELVPKLQTLKEFVLGGCGRRS
ncbi:MAG: hypothetical protein Q4A01_11240 [Coriobacteriales bacterium]|nr:hypothetical protein [Coriobacteriales bacterium]